MTQRLQPWRSGDGEKLWLSMLIDTMEKVARRELRGTPCDSVALSALRAQLARPVSPYPYWQAHRTSHFSLRN